MSIAERGYCKVFVDGAARDNLNRLVATGLSDEMTVDVRGNPDADPARADASPDGFLFFPAVLDIEPNPDVDRRIYIERVGRLLEKLWSDGLRAVAACDFEAELPRHGGYSSVA
jgi:hypothetical protein